MTCIIDHREDATAGEVFELREFQLKDADVRGCVVPADLAINLDMMADMSEPAAEAYLDALAPCETESIATFWVHDLLGIRPAIDRSGNRDEPARVDRRRTRPRRHRGVRQRQQIGGPQSVRQPTGGIEPGSRRRRAEPILVPSLRPIGLLVPKLIADAGRRHARRGLSQGQALVGVAARERRQAP
jgi:hypothetical protein